MAGLGTLIRLILRRDRIKLPVWVISFVVLLVSMVPLLQDIYGDPESLATMYATFSANPAGLFMTGPMDEPSFGAFMALETLLWWGIAIAFMNTLLIVRHTRHNEEIGAQELLLSGQVHRSSSLVAALIVALGVNAVIVLGLGFGMGLVDVTWSASQTWLYALAMGLFGFAWATIAAVVAQLVESSRSANGILAGLIGASFIVRGIGDFMGRVDAGGIHQPGWVSSLSPFGWMQATRPLTESDWVPLLVPFGFSLVAISVALMLLSQRDVGAGLLPSRKGRVRASSLLAWPLGYVLYLQKGVFIGWLAGVLIMVGTIGVLSSQMNEIFDGSDSMRQTIEAIGGAGAIVPAFLSAMMAIACLMVFAYVIHGLSRTYGEESAGHLEQLVVTGLSRLKWISLQIAVVLVGGLAMLALAGLVLALVVNSTSEFSVATGEYVLAGLSYAPVMLVFMALYILLYGFLPQVASGLSWLYFGFVAFSLWLGPIIQLNQAVMNLSIMEHVAVLPVGQVAWTPLVILTTIGIWGIILGVIAFRERDIG